MDSLIEDCYATYTQGADVDGNTKSIAITIQGFTYDSTLSVMTR